MANSDRTAFRSKRVDEPISPHRLATAAKAATHSPCGRSGRAWMQEHEASAAAAEACCINASSSSSSLLRREVRRLESRRREKRREAEEAAYRFVLRCRRRFAMEVRR